MCPQIACQRGCIAIFWIAFVRLLNVLNVQFQQLCFAKSTVSNVSSNCLPKRMHSHFWLHLFNFSPLCVFKVSTVLFGKCAHCKVNSCGILHRLSHKLRIDLSNLVERICTANPTTDITAYDMFSFLVRRHLCKI